MHQITKEGKQKLEEQLAQITVKLDKIQKLDRGSTTSWGGSFEKERLQNELYLLTEQKREIEAQLKESVVTQPIKSDKISLGVTAKLLVNKEEVTYTFVSAPEADPISGKVSIESPIGEALQGKKETHVVMVTIPTGSLTITILEIT